MEVLTLEAQTRVDSNSPPSSLLAFCVASVTVCFSKDAGNSCVPVGLTSLSALLLLLSCIQLTYQRCKHRGGDPGAMTSLYCLLGNLCGTIGAIMSKQLYIQVLGQIMDCLILNPLPERQLRMVRRRRRQHLITVCVLMALTGGLLKFEVNPNPVDRPLRGRRLLYSALHDNGEILGYIIGLLSFVITSSSRFPALYRAHRGQLLTRPRVFSGVLCSLAGVLYAAAILLYNTQLGFLLRVMPWLLSAVCGVILDLLTLAIHWCKMGMRLQPTRFSPDMESLLGDSGVSTAVTKRNRKVHSPAYAEAKNAPLTEIGRYMDVNVRQICLKEVKEVDDQSLNRTVRVIRVDSFCSSDSLCDSSLVSSDLEWDFEEGNAQWSEPKAKQPEGDEFPLQEWPSNPKPFNIHTYTKFGYPLNFVYSKEDGSSNTG
ncbi:transmembrane protein 44 [Aulostomus maculatus]